MSDGSEDRLDRVERLLENLAVRQDRSQEQLDELRLVVREGVAELGQLLADHIVETGQKQEEARQRQAETDQRFNVLLEEVRYLIRKLPGPPIEE